MKTIALKKYRLADAYKTAPTEMGFLKLAIRMAGTLGDSLYGSEAFEAVVATEASIRVAEPAITVAWSAA